jgi:hypothetical protein
MMADVAYLPAADPAEIPRTVRRNVAKPLAKTIERDIPIPAYRAPGARVTYPWFVDLKRAGDSFYADTEQEVSAARRYGYKNGWCCIVRIEGDGWRCWRGWKVR